MQFQFDELRATQAAARLLKLAGGRENYTKLLKLLYLADRKSLEVAGVPIAGATFVNMRNGPLASDVYDCIKGERPCDLWSRYVERRGFDVVLKGDPGDGELSDFDVETLDKLSMEYRSADFKVLIDVVHSLSEWKTRRPEGNTCVFLPPEEILRAAGVDDQTIEKLDEHNRHVDAVRAMLGRLPA